MESRTLQEFRPIALIFVTDWDAACKRILGLEVLERNIRHLRDLGFEPAFATCPLAPEWSERLPSLSLEEDEPYLRICGDVQYSDAFFRFLRRTIDADFDSTRDFLLPGREIPVVSWVVPGDPDPRMENLISTDAREVRSEQDLEQKALLENHLLDEIYFKTEGWIARLINKRISLPISRVLVNYSVTPNQITLANFILGICGCLMLLSLSWPIRALGAFFIQMNSVLDGCDGEVARLKVIRSKLGAWLDTITDDVLNNLMFLCLAVGIYRTDGNQSLLIFSMATVAASFGVSGFIYHYLVTHGTQNAAHFTLSWAKSGNGSAQSGWFDRIKPLLKRDFVIFAAFILVTLNVRSVLIAFLAPVWGAFFLYLASFLHAQFYSGKKLATPTL